MENPEVKLIKIKAQYEILSELDSMFPASSKHVVSVFIRKKMNELISVMESTALTEKNKFVGDFLEKAMKNHNLPHGIAYYNLLAEKCDLAEKAWIKHTKNK
jgi:hypothetical protein